MSEKVKFMSTELSLPYQDFVTNVDKQQLLLKQIEQFNNNEISEVILKEQDGENQQTETEQYSTIYGLPDCDTIELTYNIETSILKITIYRDIQCEQSLSEKDKTYVPILLINDYKIRRII
jgi:hypothetical protein